MTADMSTAQEILCIHERFAVGLQGFVARCGVKSTTRARTDGRGVLAVDAPHGAMVERWLRSAPGVLVDSQIEMCFRPFEEGKDEPVGDAAVLRESPAQIKGRGAAALDQIVDCFVRGTNPVKDRVIILLGRLGKDGHPAIDRLLSIAVCMGSAPLVGSLLRNGNAMQDRKGPQVPETLRDLLFLAKAPDEAVRRQSIRLLGALAAAEAIPVLADALLDTSEDIAVEADDAFLEMNADDEDFDFQMEPEEKRAIAEKRRRFRPKN